MRIKIILILIPLLLNGLSVNSQTFVPDDNFEQALIDLGYDIPPLDDFVPTENIENVLELNLNGAGISDLTGIEDFTDLQILICPLNNLSSIDVSQNLNLTELNIIDNFISTIDLSSNLQLQNLQCGGNNLSDLDVSENINLKILNVQDNNLSEIDISSNVELEWVILNDNNLEALNIDSNIALESLAIDDNNLQSIDLTQNINLLGLDIRDNSAIQEIDLSQNPNLESLDITNLMISTLDLSNNPNLFLLRAAKNNLSSIDISLQTGLTTLEVFENNLSEIDISANLDLQFFYVSDNQITELDLSNHPDLFAINVSGNNLEYFNISNGNNENITFFAASDNPDLSCIQVDDVAYSEANWTNIDEQTVFSTKCEPLDNLEFTDEKSLIVYPNPAYDKLIVKSPGKIESLILYDISGKNLKKVNYSSFIKVENLRAGTYLIEVKEINGNVNTLRFVKE